MKIKNFYKNLLVRNAIWVLGGSGTRIFLQAVYFLLIARALGVEQYGAFVGAVSLVAIVVPFSSWGTGFLLIRDVARNHETFARWWGTALAITLVSGSCLLFCALLASRAIWGNSIPWFVLLMVGMSDLIFVRLVDISGQVFVALEVLRKNSEVNVVLGATRTVASIYLYCFVHAPSAQIWSLLYFVGGVTAAVYAIYIVSKSHGLPSLRFYLSRSEFKQGFYFAVGLASQTVYNDLDKTLLVRWGGLAATGIYGAAYRIVDVSFAPVGALVYAAFARFFRYGEGGIEGSTMFVKKILPYTAAYGLIAALGLFFLAPYLPIFLGPQFASTTIALQLLSPLVFLKSVHSFLADSMTGAGFQGLRAGILLLVVCVNVLLNWWLIPIYSWHGAAWASLLTDGCLLMFLWCAIQILRNSASSSVIAQE